MQVFNPQESHSDFNFQGINSLRQQQNDTSARLKLHICGGPTPPQSRSCGICHPTPGWRQGHHVHHSHLHAACGVYQHFDRGQILLGGKIGRHASRRATFPQGICWQRCHTGFPQLPQKKIPTFKVS